MEVNMIYIGMFVIGAIGTFLHFLYELSGHNKIVAIFAAVNESTWEHIKICMTATLIWSIYPLITKGFSTSFIVALSLGLLTIIIMIPVFFYSYTAITKKAILAIDIICFYITVICSQLVFNYFINLTDIPVIYIALCIILLIIQLILYFTLTYHAPENFFFEDPISHKYSLAGHTELDHHHH